MESRGYLIGIIDCTNVAIVPSKDDGLEHNNIKIKIVKLYGVLQQLVNTRKL